MLVKLYRHGATRQRLLKGYVLAVQNGAAIVDAVRREWPRDRAISLYTKPQQPNGVWLDTGPVWLHTEKARAAVFKELGQAANDLATRVASRGGRLLPNAVRFEVGKDWTAWLCGDEHVLETADDVEREVCCNLVRGYTPALIALTGRSGVTGRRIERLASCQLSNSGHHYAARYLASVSPLHLGRVVQELRREEGVSRIDLLDVTPEGEVASGVPGVHLRCIDGQVLLSTARAHAILCQALLIRSRRMVRAGRRIGAMRQRLLEQNRARAIAEGLLARFEPDTDKSTPERKHARGNGKDPACPASEAAVEMLLELQNEFQVLETSYEEIAPLVLGLSLRRLGYPGIRNENDMVRAFRSGVAKRDMSVAHMLEVLVRDQRIDDRSPISQLNERSFAGPAQEVRAWWELFLQSEPIRIRRGADQRAAPTPTRKRGPSAEGDRKAPRKDMAAPDAQQAAERLFEDLRRLENDASADDRARCLESFRQNGGGNDIGKGLIVLGRDRARAAREKLRPARESQFRVRLEHAIWDSPVLQPALARARETGMAMISCEVENSAFNDALRAFSALEDTSPSDVSFYQLQQARYTVGEKQWARVEALILRSKGS